MRTLFISIAFSNITFLTQAQCNCQEEFSKIKNHLESNYAGFRDKVTKSNREQYNQFTVQKEQVIAQSKNNPITDSLYSFTDNGAGFTQNWSVPIHYIPFSSSGVGPDGSVYSYSRSGKVIRIDHVTGTITDSSQVILYGNATYPRMSIDAAGIVNVTNGGFSNGAFFSFNADLMLRWKTPITNVYIGGPLIGWDGTLVICGAGNDIRAYRGEPQATIFENSTENSEKEISLYPNVVDDYLNVSISNKLIGLDWIMLLEIFKERKYWLENSLRKMS
jgi:hypothetical protein